MTFSVSTFVTWVEQQALGGAERFNLFSVDYIKSHASRYEKTVKLIDQCTGSKVLEIGATDFFQIYLKNCTDFSDIYATIFSGSSVDKIYQKTFAAADLEANSTVFDLNLEHELYPMNGENFDLIVMCEVLEHLDIDPMFCLSELNRICKTGGKILITTPNSCSARIAYKACLGYRPHFYMQYEKTRSPYKHNFEYDVRTLKILMEAAGFQIESMETYDVFEPTWDEAVDFLGKNKMPLDDRGDDIFLLATKISPVVERWPESIYV